ncbi:MAG: ATP-binding protein [Bacteroidetes bacterium]|nr:ATP-binding protein [Bacteroidota bacterium]
MFCRKFKRDLGSLLEVFRFIDEFMSAHSFDPAITADIRLAVDELFSNMVKYQSGTAEEISITLDKQDTSIVVRLTDHGVEPFDILEVPEPDLDASLDRRSTQGLGIYLTRKCMDDVEYEYEEKGRKSIITLVKNLEG